MKFKKIKIQELKEIVRDFTQTGFDQSIESFEDWFGFNLDERDRNFIEKSFFSLS